MWQLVNCLFTASYSLYLRGTMDRVVTLTANRTKLDEFSMVFYNNLLSLPLIGVLMWWCAPGAGALSLPLSGALVWRCVPGAGALPLPLSGALVRRCAPGAGAGAARCAARGAGSPEAPAQHAGQRSRGQRGAHPLFGRRAPRRPLCASSRSL